MTDDAWLNHRNTHLFSCTWLRVSGVPDFRASTFCRLFAGGWFPATFIVLQVFVDTESRRKGTLHEDWNMLAPKQISVRPHPQHPLCHIHVFGTGHLAGSCLPRCNAASAAWGCPSLGASVVGANWSQTHSSAWSRGEAVSMS